MADVLPYLGSWGYQGKSRFEEITREYPDGSYRRYLRNSFAHREKTLTFKGVSRAVFESIRDFFEGRKRSTGDFEFLMYDPDETTTVDSSGMTAGALRAIFLDPEFNFTRDGRCRWSFDLRIKLLD